MSFGPDGALLSETDDGRLQMLLKGPAEIRVQLCTQDYALEMSALGEPV